MIKNNLKDREFKEYCKAHLGERDINPYNADYTVDLNGGLYNFEYENSSRGMVHNLIKYYMLPKPCKYIVVVFIRTRHHQENHQLDFNRFNFILEQLKSREEYIFIETINEQDFATFIKKTNF